MHRTFAALDELLIERMFQPLCDSIRQRLGLTCCAAACLCLDVALVGWIMARAPALSEAMAAWASAAFPDLAILLLGLAALVALRIMFQRVGSLCSLYRVNPLRLAMRPHRAVILLLLMSRLMQPLSPNLGDAADVAMLVFAAIALYLAACAERPAVRRPCAMRAGASAG